MIEQETALALLEAKEMLEKAQNALRHLEIDEHGEVRELVLGAHLRVSHALGLIESILAKGR